MQIPTPIFSTKNKVFPNLIAINSTLYELIEAINEEVKPEDDKLVSEIVSDLYNRGVMKFLNEAEHEKLKNGGASWR